MSMKKLKTADLAGAALDWAVAKAERFTVEACELPRIVVERSDLQSSPLTFFSPSTTWSDGGPIIEREDIALCKDEGNWMADLCPAADKEQVEAYGSSALVAAMRAYVISKFGTEIDIPSALCCETKPGTVCLKVADLEGQALDVAVGMCIGLSHKLHGRIPFTTDWTHAGPIIEREAITVDQKDRGALIHACVAAPEGNEQNDLWANGKTALEAAMRVFVMLKFGAEIELPEAVAA